MLDFTDRCVTVLASVVGVRRRSEGSHKNSNNEPMKLVKPGIQPAKTLNDGWTPMDTAVGRELNREQRLGGYGKKRLGRRGFAGLSGWEVGKAPGFYRLATGCSHLETALNRLFPHKSTQVVDFPHLADAGLFWEGPEIVLATAGTRDGSGWQWTIDKAHWTAKCRRNCKEINWMQVGESGQKWTWLVRRGAHIKRVVRGGLAFVRGRDIGMFRAYWMGSNYGIGHLLEAIS